MNMLTPFNFDPFFSRTVGFERIFDRLNSIAEENAHTPSYPPYNINRHSEDKFDIELAVAGFKEEELNVEYKDNTITVEGKKEEEKEDSDYLHRGIATRSFRRTWHLEDHTEAIGAKLENGLLKIHLEKIVPEELRPRKIKINKMREDRSSSDAELLNEASTK